jgi:hypothetical protein
VQLWKAENHCDDSANCPSPIIVIATGGASRAAFMTASTLGLMLDVSCPEKNRRDAGASERGQLLGCSEAPAFGKRLFAISSVPLPPKQIAPNTPFVSVVAAPLETALEVT